MNNYKHDSNLNSNSLKSSSLSSNNSNLTQLIYTLIKIIDITRPLVRRFAASQVKRNDDIFN